MLIGLDLTYHQVVVEAVRVRLYVHQPESHVDDVPFARVDAVVTVNGVVVTVREVWALDRVMMQGVDVIAGTWEKQW